MKFILKTVLIMMPVIAFADVPNKFVNGTPANADYVNENFDFLDSAIEEDRLSLGESISDIEISIISITEAIDNLEQTVGKPEVFFVKDACLGSHNAEHENILILGSSRYKVLQWGCTAFAESGLLNYRNVRITKIFKEIERSVFDNSFCFKGDVEQYKILPGHCDIPLNIPDNLSVPSLDLDSHTFEIGAKFFYVPESTDYYYWPVTSSFTIINNGDIPTSKISLEGFNSATGESILTYRMPENEIEYAGSYYVNGIYVNNLQVELATSSYSGGAGQGIFAGATNYETGDTIDIIIKLKVLQEVVDTHTVTITFP